MATKRRATKGKLSNESIAGALQKAGGVVADAAKLLGVARRTLHKRLAVSAALRGIRDEAREETLDLAESKLLAKIREGNLIACIFYLKTQGRSRGYVERSEIAGAEGVVPIKFYLPKKAALPPDDEPLATIPAVNAPTTEGRKLDA